MSEYCTYLTFYSGKNLPPFYIGSTSVEKIKKGSSWWNNGYESKMSKQCPGEGWLLGRGKINFK